RRRAAALAAVGLVAVSGALGARDALVVWPRLRETFDGFHGQDTLIGRAALRWGRYGEVTVAPRLGHSPVLIRATCRYGLDPDFVSSELPDARRARVFRVLEPEAAAQPGERTVERIRDGWGRDWARVAGRRGPG